MSNAPTDPHSSLPLLLLGSGPPCLLGTAAGSSGNMQGTARRRFLSVALPVLLCSVLRELLLQRQTHENLLIPSPQDKTPLTS